MCYLFTENSLPSNLNFLIMKFRKEEQKEVYQDAFPYQCHYLNYPIQYDDFFLDTLESVPSNTTTVGIDGIPYQMLNHLFLGW